MVDNSIKEIKVSVIIPVYNSEHFLKRCLDSIVNQTLKEIEIIIINDGSTDGSEKIIKDYLSDERIVYLKKENEGAYAARQDGINIARGEYIGFADTDDWVEADMFEKLYISAKSNNADIAVCGAYMDDYKMPQYIADGTYTKDRISKEVIPFVLSAVTSKKCEQALDTWSLCTKLIRRGFLIENDIVFNRQIKCAQDFLYCVESLGAADTAVSICGEHMYHWVTKSNYSSITRSYRKNLLSTYKMIIGRLSEILVPEKDPKLNEHFNICIFFLASATLENEWINTNLKKKEILQKLDELAKEPIIKKALPYVPKEKLSERHKSDYDALLCESGEKMAAALKSHSLYGRMRTPMRLKRKLSKYRLFSKLLPKVRKKAIRLFMGKKKA